MTRINGSVPDGRNSTRPRPFSSCSADFDGIAHLRQPDDVSLLVETNVDQLLRILLHLAGELAETLLRIMQGRQHLKRRDYAIPRGGAVPTDDVSRLLATQDAVFLFKARHDIAVADLGAREAHAEPMQGVLQSQITHQRTHHVTSELLVA